MSNVELSGFLGHWLPRIEIEMRAVLAHEEAAVASHYGMLEYHMGWVNEAFQPQLSPSGKRIRPVLCLLACAEVGGDPVQALPAAAAIELLHNFSLIHDDIEDGDETRRHRPTLWKVWGVPLAINAGDALFTLAFAAIQQVIRRGVPLPQAFSALDIFTQTCLALTEGQYLDISFEAREDVTVADYMRMIQGKTAALIGASTAIGALLGGASAEQVYHLSAFGQAMGLTFQIQDDILGIWGDPAVTGKAAGNDVLRRKKSLPMLHALNHSQVGEQFETLMGSPLRAEDLPHALRLLEQADAKAVAEAAMQAEHAKSITALQNALGERAQQTTLWALAESLLHRQA
ncbi:MAG: polyprenyl synthetase family protein [Caldilineaceae bacterium]|nr:polyprenyl synthetase family protein [Caldilineaceae bacterium]